MFDEEPTVMEMLVQRKDARGSQGQEAKESKLYLIQSPTAT